LREKTMKARCDHGGAGLRAAAGKNKGKSSGEPALVACLESQPLRPICVKVIGEWSASAPEKNGRVRFECRTGDDLDALVDAPLLSRALLDVLQSMADRISGAAVGMALYATGARCCRIRLTIDSADLQDCPGGRLEPQAAGQNLRRAAQLIEKQGGSLRMYGGPQQVIDINLLKAL
jgi:hypothetical protein